MAIQTRTVTKARVCERARGAGVVFAVTCLFALVTEGGVFSIRPIEFARGNGYSMVATGSLSTVGDSAVIDDWNLTVTTVERLARYTPANTRANVSQTSVSSDGQSLTVDTSPDPSNEDGGFLGFRSANPWLDFWATPADFTGPNALGGQASFAAGGAFDFLDLGQPAGSAYPVAQASLGGGSQFELLPVHFAGGFTLQGTVTTDGTRGQLTAGNLQSWDIVVDQVTRDVFDKSNSTLHAAGIGLSPDGLSLGVTNPQGYFSLVKGIAGGHLYGLQLADFTDSTPSGGQAGYFQGRLAVTTLPLHAPAGFWALTGDEPITSVPEPASCLLLGCGLGWYAVRRLKRTPALALTNVREDRAAGLSRVLVGIRGGSGGSTDSALFHEAGDHCHTRG